MSGSSTCRSCGRPIVWAYSTNGKRMPVDETPVPDGNLVLFGGHVRHTGHAPTAQAFNAERHAGQPRYVSHFATCPNASQHRRPR